MRKNAKMQNAKMQKFALRPLQSEVLKETLANVNEEIFIFRHSLPFSGVWFEVCKWLKIKVVGGTKM